MQPPAIPSSTYRLQFNASFTFADATAIVDYLDALGVSHCYASSYLKAVPGSTHGYDVADPTQLNPEIGDERSLLRWVAALRDRGMGHILDVVPNHMGIGRSANPWWHDVLENGPSSRYAHIFDIDWHPLKPELDNKVLLPILGDLYGAVLERREIRLEYVEGAFQVRYGDFVLPVAPGTYDRVLEHESRALLDALGTASEDEAEFLSILTAIRHLPSRDVQEELLKAERHREKEVVKRRLAALSARSPQVLAHINRSIEHFNGRIGEPRSFDPLDALLSSQAYRLAHWRVAAEEINYRRFFDINDLAAIRMEDTEVFDLVHGYVFSLVGRGVLDGLRIDHVDGLFDPGDYLERLQTRAREVRGEPEAAPLYVVVEKILGATEELPRWPVAGTSGYDYLAKTNALFVDGRNERATNTVYEQFTRRRTGYAETAYLGKEWVLRSSMASELNVLAHQLNRFSERNRYCRDFTLNNLAFVLREIIACFPVYRTYVNAREPVSDRDRHYIAHAVREAKRRHPRQPPLAFDFVRDLLLKNARFIEPPHSEEYLRFVGKFQQLTSPVTAKGIEDTALYIYNRLVSLNDVGSEPDLFGVAPDTLHRWLAARRTRWPHGLSATSSHDTKRSEDVRARLNVLSELPGAWKQAIARWARINRRGRTVLDGHSYPSRNEEYLLYQTLVGSWPMHQMSSAEEADYQERIVEYMHKAMREAKVFTNWLNPSPAHEDAMARFVTYVVSPENTAFREEFVPFQERIARYGVFNALAQVALKIGAPGVPDFYQGTEVWDLSLVDPDNRRPVDYDRRQALLRELDAMPPDVDSSPLARHLLEHLGDDRIKLFATSRLLRFRRERQAPFGNGSYVPLGINGARPDHVFAFARVEGHDMVLVVVPRLLATLLPDADILPLGDRVWGDLRISLPAGAPPYFRNVLTNRCVPVVHEGRESTVRVADVFEHFPVSFLESPPATEGGRGVSA